MNYEVFFEINGGFEEERRVSIKIAQFLVALEKSGDIANLDVTTLYEQGPAGETK